MEPFTAERTVGQIVTENPARSRVFERRRIDYCCGGKKTLGQACVDRNVPLETIVSELIESDKACPEPDIDLRALSLTDLCDHIVKTHHASLRESLPRLTLLTAKVGAVHGDADPSLKELAAVFSEFRQAMEQHTAKEEVILFPLVRRLDAGERMAASHCGSIANPIRVMLAEHDEAGGSLERMRSLTNGYAAPSHACNTYRAMLKGLEQLETETHRHVHAENEVLFPRAIAPEAAARLEA